MKTLEEVRSQLSTGEFEFSRHAFKRVVERNSWWLISLAFKENAFAAPVVKHREERHQTVVDTGVYGRVRHPQRRSFLKKC